MRLALEIAGALWLASWVACAAVGARLLGLRYGARFAAVQLVSTWIAAPVGWLLLLPFCLARAWTVPPDVRSIKPLAGPEVFRDRVDRWLWDALNEVYGNPEDGVSGLWAVVHTASGLAPYLPGRPAWWRAYCWSAWRNSAGNLKYVFENTDAIAGPLAAGTWLGGRPYRIGWHVENGFNVPVLSL